jgi:hypothetical protein
MLSLDDIWMRLSTEDIGFFTRRRATRIPEVPGVYGWFLPMRMNDGPRQLLSLARRVYCYDAGCLGAARWTHKSAGFRWDRLQVDVARNPEVEIPERHEQTWASVASGSAAVKRRFEKSLLVSTIFSRPLYVGLTKNLFRRYQQHVAGEPDSNNFHNRFSSYMVELNEQLTVEQLLFVCIPLRKATGELGDLTEQQIQLLEHVLKTVCQPVFDDR